MLGDLELGSCLLQGLLGGLDSVQFFLQGGTARGSVRKPFRPMLCCSGRSEPRSVPSRSDREGDEATDQDSARYFECNHKVQIACIEVIGNDRQWVGGSPSEGSL